MKLKLILIISLIILLIPGLAFGAEWPEGFSPGSISPMSGDVFSPTQEFIDNFENDNFDVCIYFDTVYGINMFLIKVIDGTIDNLDLSSLHTSSGYVRGNIISLPFVYEYFSALSTSWKSGYNITETGDKAILGTSGGIYDVYSLVKQVIPEGVIPAVVPAIQQLPGRITTDGLVVLSRALLILAIMLVVSLITRLIRFYSR